MALIGKAACRGYRSGLLSLNQQAARAQQAYLHEIGMRRSTVGGAEGPGELEAIRGPGRSGKRVRADILRYAVVQPLARPARNAFISSGNGGPRRAPEMPAQQV